MLVSITHDYGPDEDKCANNGGVAGKSRLQITDIYFTILSTFKIILILFLDGFSFTKVYRIRYSVANSRGIKNFL